MSGHKETYLRDGWNVLDFAVVIVCLLPFLFGNMSALRVFRLLRPLRFLSLLPGMRGLVSTLLDSLPDSLLDMRARGGGLAEESGRT